MRLRHLALERYGRFEDCRLDFRAGEPDLHVVYGANEAGKTTTMAAVSDLLFGFEMRSRYNFRFDYPLLRVGADLEEDGAVLPVRRRKSNAGSLVDAGDKPLDEGPLAAMLHGQTRERFRLAFSLDHVRLREGGRAMVQARDDVGQALFAAGSGMTGVVDAMRVLDAEADAIWAPRRAKHRAFTQAETAYEAARAAARDRQVRPKAWTDARAALAAAEETRDRIGSERDALVIEQTKLERLRRIAPAMRRRAELAADLALDGDRPTMPAAREERVLAALGAMAEAERRRTAAAALVAETDARLAAVAVDDAALEAAEAVETLVERRGAVAKATGDAERLRAERRAKAAEADALRAEIGMAAERLPQRATVARLREIARAHGEASAALRAIGDAADDMRARMTLLEGRLADADLSEGLPAMTDAVETARRLGADFDERCAAASSAAESAGRQADAALGRLAPWSGTVDVLAAMPTLGDAEIASIEADLARLREIERAAIDAGGRASEDGARLAMERGALARDGTAVAVEDLLGARARRDEALRAVLAGVPAAGSAGPDRGADCEAAVRAADDLADRRFAYAAESAKLRLLDEQGAAAELRASQERSRSEDAERRSNAMLADWHSRLTAIGMPALDPSRTRAWLADRAAAIEAGEVARRLSSQAAADASRGRDARLGLSSLLPDQPDDGLVATILTEAERRLGAAQARHAAYAADHAELRRVSEALAAQVRLASRRTGDLDAAVAAWNDVQSRLGTSFMIEDGDAPLASIERLRAVVDEVDALDVRLAGIDVDRIAYENDLAALWEGLGAAGRPDVDHLRKRLIDARSTAALGRDLVAERGRRVGDQETAAADHSAALKGLEPVLRELDGVAVEALDDVVQTSRRLRAISEEFAAVEQELLSAGDGLALDVLEGQWRDVDPDEVVSRAGVVGRRLASANANVTAAAEVARDAALAFQALDGTGGDASAAIFEAEEARAEMAVQAEAYILRRAQVVALRWAIERHRRERQDPLLERAGALFDRLTLGRYGTLRVDHEADHPRLLGVSPDGRSAIDVDAMSEGTADQLFLALRLASIEQSVAAGVRVPFLADDLFINFDDERARAGFEVLAELARSTQVLFFTHHRHLADMARDVVGVDIHSECSLQG